MLHCTVGRWRRRRRGEDMKRSVDERKYEKGRIGKKLRRGKEGVGKCGGEKQEVKERKMNKDERNEGRGAHCSQHCAVPR